MLRVELYYNKIHTVLTFQDDRMTETTERIAGEKKMMIQKKDMRAADLRSIICLQKQTRADLMLFLMVAHVSSIGRAA